MNVPGQETKKGDDETPGETKDEDKKDAGEIEVYIASPELFKLPHELLSCSSKTAGVYGSACALFFYPHGATR